MDRELRAKFNGAWHPGHYAAVQDDLKRRLGCDVPFRVAETPVFFDRQTKDRFAAAANEVLAAISDPGFIAIQDRYLPDAFRAAEHPPLPHLAQLDFAVVREPDGSLGPRLVELQGFPSLYGFQITMADVWATQLALMPGMPDRWRLFFSDMDRYHAMAILRETLVGSHDPQEVVLLDYEPLNQKTYPDFAVTERWFGIEPVCVTDIIRDGDKLFRRKDGRTIPVRRIYHRVVVDELERNGLEFPFDMRHPPDVEWVPHPAWWYLWSKSTLLHLDLPSVPFTRLLTEVDELPDDLTGHILKPLYSFAGAGVNVEPTHEDLHAVPRAERRNWVLQEKLDYVPAFESVNGDGVKLEIRMMYVRPDDAEEMTLLLNLVRLSRGKMMGVDYNRDMDWTGASVAIWAD